jgi:hypothetical protein
MTISNWVRRSATQTVTLAIASLGFWNVAIADVKAQAGPIIVYMAGNNPITLGVARQVVTNPVIALVNGQTSIVAGTFDAETANFVTRELQRRGLAAQQTYQSYQPQTYQPQAYQPQTYQPQTYQPINQPASTSPYVTLPNYLPANTATTSIENSAQYRYVTAIPMSTGGIGALEQVRRLIPNAFIAKSSRGNYIYAGGYINREAAESLKHFLRSQGLDARVLYF